MEHGFEPDFCEAADPEPNGDCAESVGGAKAELMVPQVPVVASPRRPWRLLLARRSTVNRAIKLAAPTRAVVPRLSSPRRRDGAWVDPKHTFEYYGFYCASACAGREDGWLGKLRCLSLTRRRM
jgi:hypothetical protein